MRSRRSCDAAKIIAAALPVAAFARGGAKAFAAAADRLKSLALELPRLCVLTPSELAHWYPVAEPHDPVADAIGHIPYTEAFFCAIGAAAARGLLPTLAPSTCSLLKCVVVDCDYTLWHGAVSEIGVDKLIVEPRHLELQERLLALRQRGVLLCLCSRNEPNDVWDALDRDDLCSLRRSHISASRIDPLLSKADAIKSIASELRLSPANLLFIDDNPSEVAEVSATLPEVAVWCWPQLHMQAKLELQHIWPLDTGAEAGADGGGYKTCRDVPGRG